MRCVTLAALLLMVVVVVSWQPQVEAADKFCAEYQGTSFSNNRILIGSGEKFEDCCARNRKAGFCKVNVYCPFTNNAQGSEDQAFAQYKLCQYTPNGNVKTLAANDRSGNALISVNSVCPASCNDAVVKAKASAEQYGCGGAEFLRAEAYAKATCGNVFAQAAASVGGVCDTGKPSTDSNGTKKPVPVKTTPVCKASAYAVSIAVAQGGCGSVSFSKAVAIANTACGAVAFATSISVAIGGSCPLTCAQSLGQLQAAANQYGCNSQQYREAAQVSISLCGTTVFSREAARICGKPDTCKTAVTAVTQTLTDGCGRAYAAALAIAVDTCSGTSAIAQSISQSSSQCPITCDQAIQKVKGAIALLHYPIMF